MSEKFWLEVPGVDGNLQKVSFFPVSIQELEGCSDDNKIDVTLSEIKRLEEIINRRIKDFEGAIECFARAGLGISYKIQKLEEELKRLCQDKAKQGS